MKVVELISSVIVAEKCRAVFGLLGDGNLSLWAMIHAEGAVPLYTAWHEAAAVAMADAYARSCGEVGVATVTCGPGLTHAATSLISAVRHGSPLVLLVGDLPASDVGGNQQLDQRRFAEACGARFRTLLTPDQASGALRSAFHEARTQSCPVVLSLPMDVQEADVPAGTPYAAAPAYPDIFYPSGTDPSGIEAITDLISASDYPVVIAGRGAIERRTRNAVLEFADSIGAAVGTSLLAKDCFSGHPRNIGVIGGIARGATRRVLAHADLLIAFGASLGYHTTDRGTQMPLARIVRVNTGPASDGDEPPSTIHLRSDAGTAARALRDAVLSRKVQKTGFTDMMMGSEFVPASWPDWPVANDGMDPRRVMRALSAVLPPRVQIACGIGHFWSFPIMYLDLPCGGTFHSTHSFGAIGFGLPFGMGLSVAAPQRPVLIIEGDGSLMQALSELESAARQRLSLVILVMNDNGYGAEAHKMAAKGFDGAMARWVSPDFAAMATLLGGKGVRVDDEADLAPAVKEAFADGGLHLIDARISPSIVSDLYQQTLFGTAIE